VIGIRLERRKVVGLIIVARMIVWIREMEKNEDDNMPGRDEICIIFSSV